MSDDIIPVGNERPRALDLADLPFVKSTAAGRNWWAVAPTDDYLADNDQGSDYARLLLEYLAQHEEADPGLIGRVAAAMPSAHDGVTVDFWFHLGCAAKAGREHANRVRAWQKEEMARIEARKARERSERSRKAARTRRLRREKAG